MEETRSDPALVAAALGGDRGGFDELVRRHEPRVRRLVERAVRDADTRDELVQQTFCAAFQRLRQLTAAERVGSWLARIAQRFVATDRARAARREELGEREWEHAPERTAASAWIWEEVALLAPIHAEVLHLRYRETLSYAEVAARLDLPHSTVRGRIHEARRALRARLEAELGDLR